ncbi:MAG TPA: flagellar motor protein MotB [Chthonomonas sp.]|uniref:flagellar motor protein MotB n=1 Tax=Chthonomonas sp. TaxID=2282153 RepID=UPI002B4B785E|nr:flagellar motor protein MotB [Chthonomonas sp.]HLI48910.1 flagellar motor protein MotB [Chthonomonas sp.]
MALNENDANPIIIRIVKKKRGGGHHGGAWKVAYADFVTAMMAFFLVMWIVGLSKPIRDAIAAYFRDPTGFMKTAHGGKSPLADQPQIKQGKPAPLIPQDGGFATNATVNVDFQKVKQAILSQIMRTPELKGLRDSIEIHLTPEGLRIELMEKTPALFFDTGSARLKPRTIELLRIIAHQLRKLNNPIIVEGHTDARPYGTPYGYSNWELSTDRANAARRAMEENGLRPRQVLAVRGYADRKLLDPAHPYSYVNRRVSILVAYTAKGV